MKKLLTLFFFFILLRAFGTAQYPDKIIYQGKEYDLLTNPLESYFEQYPEKRPQGGLISTALWRGYVATFKIKDNELLLEDIQIQIWDSLSKNHETLWVSALDQVFPSQEKTKIDWFTGLLVLPFGDLVNYVHMGYASTYENYIILEINAGNFNRSKKMNNAEYVEFKEKQFIEFKKTEQYQKLFAELKGRNDSDEFVEGFIKSYVIEYSEKFLTD